MSSKPVYTDLGAGFSIYENSNVAVSNAALAPKAKHIIHACGFHAKSKHGREWLRLKHVFQRGAQKTWKGRETSEATNCLLAPKLKYFASQKPTGVDALLLVVNQSAS